MARATHIYYRVATTRSAILSHSAFDTICFRTSSDDLEYGRPAMIASAVASLTPGKVSSSSFVALLILTGPLRDSPSNTPCATAFASRFAAAVAFAVCSLIASGLLDSVVHPAKASTETTTAVAKILMWIQMPALDTAGTIRHRSRAVSAAFVLSKVQ